MPDSILDTVKKAIGFDPDYTAFDPDILMHINSTFAVLQQIGVGPEEGFFISDSVPTWDAYLDNALKLNMAKSYMFIKVQLLFDPPSTSFALDARKQLAQEYEWRMQVAADKTPTSIPTEGLDLDD